MIFKNISIITWAPYTYFLYCIPSMSVKSPSPKLIRASVPPWDIIKELPFRHVPGTICRPCHNLTVYNLSSWRNLKSKQCTCDGKRAKKNSKIHLNAANIRLFDIPILGFYLLVALCKAQTSLLKGSKRHFELSSTVRSFRLQSEFTKPTNKPTHQITCCCWILKLTSQSDFSLEKV